MIRGVVQQGLELVERIDVRAEPHCSSGRGQQPVDRSIGALPLEPVSSDERWCGAGALEPTGRVAVHRHALVGRKPLGESLADELVAEAVAPVADHDHSGGQRNVEQREGVLLGAGRERGDLGRVEVASDEREAGEHRGMGLGKIDEPDERGVARPKIRRLSRVDSPGQLDEEQRVAAGEADDRLDCLGVRPFLRRGDHQRRGLILRERFEVELEHEPGAGERRAPRSSARGDRSVR